jgi:probable F420-dependent oxidoreductase
MSPQFGVSISQSAAEGHDPVADAHHAESLGFDFLTVSDHLHGTHPTFETWTLLTWIAASTSRIRVGPNVLGLPYRPPAVVAKMAETLDRMSGGRLVLGLGAGGSDAEFRGFGVALRTPAEKIGALEEAITVIRLLWSEKSVSFEGQHFRLREAELEPKPERPIPIWLGTYGNRALELTGRLAGGWISSYPYAPPDVAAEKLARVRRAAEAAGRAPDELTYAYNVGVYVDERARPTERLVAGPPQEVAERISGFLGLGFTAINFWPRGGAEQRERLAHEVIPSLGRG